MFETNIRLHHMNWLYCINKKYVVLCMLGVIFSNVECLLVFYDEIWVSDLESLNAIYVSCSSLGIL